MDPSPTSSTSAAFPTAGAPSPTNPRSPPGSCPRGSGGATWSASTARTTWNSTNTRSPHHDAHSQWTNCRPRAPAVATRSKRSTLHHAKAVSPAAGTGRGHQPQILLSLPHHVTRHEHRLALNCHDQRSETNAQDCPTRTNDSRGGRPRTRATSATAVRLPTRARVRSAVVRRRRRPRHLGMPSPQHPGPRSGSRQPNTGAEKATAHALGHAARTPQHPRPRTPTQRTPGATQSPATATPEHLTTTELTGNRAPGDRANYTERGPLWGVFPSPGAYARM